MRVLPFFFMTVTAAAALSGCMDPPNRADAAPALGPRWVDAGTPSAVVEREVRYYKDEQGAIWDDRGKKQAP